MKPEAGDKRYLKKECTRRGWGCHVLIDTVRKKWPDRTLTAPGGRIAFVEVKAEGASRNKAHVEAQKARLRELRELGFLAFFVVGKPGIDSYLRILEKAYQWPWPGVSGDPTDLELLGDNYPLKVLEWVQTTNHEPQQTWIESLGLPGIEPV